MAAGNGACQDPAILDQWHPLWAIDETMPNVVYVTRLLGESVSFAVTADGGAAVWRTRGDLTAGMPVDPESIADTLPSRSTGYCSPTRIPRINYPALRRWTDRVRRIPGFETMPGIFPASPG